MAFIKNGQGNKKDAMNITFWKFRNKGHYAKDFPDKKGGTGTDADASRQSVSAHATNGI